VSQEVLNIGLLGCGAISQFAHLPALAKARRVTLRAICDGAEDLLNTIGQRYGVRQLYRDYAAFLRDAEIDAVLIAAPDMFHVPLATQALAAGKHVLVEKPLGTNSAECRELLQTVQRTGLKLQVAAMKRHDPGMAFAHRFVQQRLGQVLSVSGWYCDTLFRPALQETLLPPTATSGQSIRPSTDPKADKQHYSLITHGAHLFDNIRYLGGSVSGVATRHAERFGQHSWHGLLEFEQGGIGHFELTVKVNSDWSEGYRVYGEHGSVEVKTFLPFYYRPSEVRAFDARTEQWHTPLGAHSNPYKNQLEAFARSVLDGEPVNPDAADGLATVRLLEAVEESLNSGQPVSIPKESCHDSPLLSGEGQGVRAARSCARNPKESP
jgi:predicted dehydrogenase